MKKALLSVVSFCLLFACSCNKKNNDNSTSGIWNIGNIQYSASVVKKQGNGFTASNGLNSMQVYFAGTPTTTANYKIVDENKATSGTLGPNEVAIAFSVDGTDSYLTTGTANDSASIAIDGGVLTIKVSPTPVQHYAGGPALDLNIASGVIKTNSF